MNALQRNDMGADAVLANDTLNEDAQRVGNSGALRFFASLCVAVTVGAVQLPFAPTVPPNNPIDLQSLKWIDFHLLRWSAQQRLFTVLGALTSMLKTSAQLRLENLALRQQLAVLGRSAPKRLKLTPADRIFWV